MRIVFSLKTIYRLTAILFLTTISHGSIDTIKSIPSIPPDTIAAIIVSGNKVTGTEIIHHLSGLKLGMPFDSSVLEKARIRLKETGLFFKVDLFSIRSKERGCQVYIIVNEKYYFLPYNVGGEWYSSKYGKPKQWLRARLGMQYSNFRGKAEVLKANVSIWDWKSVYVGWYKPFLPSPWFFSFVVSAQLYPDQVFQIDHRILASSITCGRKLPFNSRAELTVMPRYRLRLHYDSSVTTVIDTERVYEAFSLLRFRTSHLNYYFDPSQGWSLFCDIRTNSLYSGIAPAFYQLFSDFRWYTPGFVKGHKFACRITSVLRNTDAGSTHRLQLGGEGSIRGYVRNQFGRYFYANNSFVFSVEYRFPLIHFPVMNLYPMSDFVPVFKAVEYHLDGAVIMDYGRITAQYKELLDPAAQHIEQGTAIGLGLRGLTTTFERSMCIDVLWGTNPWSNQGFVSFMKKPQWHFYLDTFY